MITPPIANRGNSNVEKPMSFKRYQLPDKGALRPSGLRRNASPISASVIVGNIQAIDVDLIAIRQRVS
ncbi:hypothetical protein KCP74_03845 [Salmonella enterica subsp. enterica]|nr:hypothetical protein KCP74_03845 [Salmonella enterica subsp. enterica]